MSKKLKEKRLKGFTIIEVMIVLAIAGLIMVVVLIAVPQLQRNQRNSATRAVADRIMTELQNYATNNNGNYPSSTGTQRADFCQRYLQRQTTATPPVADCTGTGSNVVGASFINDPRTGTPMPIAFTDNETPPTAAADATGGVARSIKVHMGTSGYRCNGETPAVASGARQIALTIYLEGGAIVCRDNQ